MTKYKQCKVRCKKSNNYSMTWIPSHLAEKEVVIFKASYSLPELDGPHEIIKVYDQELDEYMIDKMRKRNHSRNEFGSINVK